jgi:uracil phosphoribosyltransferase
MKSSKNFILVDHPIVKRDLTILRDKKTNPEIFRAALRRVSIVLAVALSKDFEITESKIKTPLESTIGYKLKNQVVLVPVLRAGLGMVAGFLEIFPDSKVGHIGLQRDEVTLNPIEYYYKTPKNISDAKVVLLDPMLATGGSSSEAIKYLKKRGAKNIAFACLVAAPEGLKRVLTDHKNIKVFSAGLDRQLNDKGYIVPGLGDAGDRTFGTL